MKNLLFLSLIYPLLLINQLKANDTPCNCGDIQEAAIELIHASNYNQACVAYLEYQIAHVKFYADLSQKLLSSGHQTGVMMEQLRKVRNIANSGVNKLRKEKNSLMEIKMDPETYKAQLSRINTLGTKEFKKASGAMYVIINGGKQYVAQADGPPVDSGCSSQRMDLVQACLQAIQDMMECGVYDDISTTQLRDDQEKCTEKGNAIMVLCNSENNGGRHFSAQDDVQNEMTKAMDACHHHNSIKSPGGAPAQTQTSSGF